MKPNVTVRCKGNRRLVDPRTVRRRGERLLMAVGRQTAELSILLCDDIFIRELNRKYRGRDIPTDVLSFPMNEGETPNPYPDLLGDVVISVETAVQQAAQGGLKPLDEVTSLLIHGLLHLLGYDHKKPGQEDRMRAKTNSLLELLAIEARFNRSMKSFQ